MVLFSEMPLTPNPDRFVLLPIKYPELWDFYKRAQASFWTAEELDFESDKRDWAKLNAGQRHFIETVLAFFAASDGIVNENLGVNFFNEVQIPEARCFYAFQMAMENVHSETYGQLIESFVESPQRRTELFQGMKTFSSIKKKAEWALCWMNKDAPFGERIVAFACVEGISFSSSFCAIFYLKKQGLMCQGLGKSNEFISRDEGLHRDFACAIYNMLDPVTQKVSETRIHEIIRGCVEVERDFVCEALPVSLIGMNSDQMQRYVEFVSDSLCVALGIKKLYNSSNPFEWMEHISLTGKTNFFEGRVGEYSKAGYGKEDKQLFLLNEEF